MEARMINVEHSGPNANQQHYKQHFQQHYAATSDSNLGTSGRFPTVLSPSPTGFSTSNYQSGTVGGVKYETQRHENSSRHHTPMASYETHSQLVHTNAIDQNGNIKEIEQKHEEQKSKKTVQTTTTTTTTQPVIISSDESMPLHHSHEVFQPVVSVHPIQTSYLANSNLDLIDPNSYTIKVEHHPTDSFNWSNADVYLHIFLTFYFGHFAAMLFFDGILRNIANLFLFEHTTATPFIFVIHIIFSIAYLAFTIWFMTICWRWWRYKSLLPTNGMAYFDHTHRPLRPKDRQANANGYVFIAACILIIGFFIYLSIGIIDLWYKKHQQENTYTLNRYSNASYLADLIVFIFRLIFWIVGIVATLLLSREVLMKYCCPSKQIKIDKEKPTTVYEIRS